MTGKEGHTILATHQDAQSAKVHDPLHECSRQETLKSSMSPLSPAPLSLLAAHKGCQFGQVTAGGH